MKNSIKKGFISGFIATLVLTMMMIIKGKMGIMPALDPVGMMTNTVHAKLGLPQLPVIGWLMHFGIGTIAWGGAFSIFNKWIPTQKQLTKGIIFGVVAWFIMMLIPMPMMGAGLFALNIGIQATVMTLVLHLVFGVVLGVSYQKLLGE